MLDAAAGPADAAELYSGICYPLPADIMSWPPPDAAGPLWGNLPTNAVFVGGFHRLLSSSCIHVGYRRHAAGTGRPAA